MAKKAAGAARREESLSQDRIIEAAIQLLDRSGEGGLTFRALSQRLATGPGAIYWHIANKSDLVTAACDAVVARTLKETAAGAAPEAAIRALALGWFDTIAKHPWVGSSLTRVSGHLPIVRLLERIGRQVRALGVPPDEQWPAVSALMAYILGVSGQNAANRQLARERGLNRSDFLKKLSLAWLQLDPDEYAFTRSVAQQMRTHNDRADFLTGLNLILNGINSPGSRRSRPHSEPGSPTQDKMPPGKN